jgi:transcriptional regulator GlxA family with amidase domain
MIDAHARMGETFETNPPLGAYAQLQTRLLLAGAVDGPLELAGGRRIACDMAYAAIGEMRMIYLPSFQFTHAQRMDALLQATGPLHSWLKQAAEAGIIIGASGASVLHLAAAGLLDNQICAVPVRYQSYLRQRFPKVRIAASGPLTVSGQFLTCSGDDLCPALVNRMIAEAFSPALGRALQHMAAPDGQTGADDGHTDPVVARAQQWIRDRFARDFRIADIARDLGISHQTLIRRFRAAHAPTPKHYAQRLRVEAAASMLTETTRSVAEIAQLVGYRDTPSFRQVFTAMQGISPGQHRKESRARQSRR